jgi:hypothetical protein
MTLNHLVRTAEKVANIPACSRLRGKEMIVCDTMTNVMYLHFLTLTTLTSTITATAIACFDIVNLDFELSFPTKWSVIIN